MDSGPDNLHSSGPAELTAYYARRAPEYDRIYIRPERQADLAVLRDRVAELMRGEEVLEIACGTGYWTAVIAATARSVLATDGEEAPLAQARQKAWGRAPVRFLRADAYRLEEVQGVFTAAFGGFWWSHVLRERLEEFLGGLHRRLGPGARVVFLDNRYVEGSNTPIARRDERGNSYQNRKLADGSSWSVLKNFPTAEEVRQALGPAAREVQVEDLTYYWCASYRIA